jgi:hypothetical protein
MSFGKKAHHRNYDLGFRVIRLCDLAADTLDGTRWWGATLRPSSTRERRLLVELFETS